MIIHCCLSEKSFNPYYAVVTQKFCEFDRKYQLAVQFSVWDRIKDIGSLSTTQIKNLAQYLVYLIANSAQPLSVLKVIEFGELDKLTLRLVRQILLGLLLGPEEICDEVCVTFPLGITVVSCALFSRFRSSSALHLA